ncbi:hypothetical protein [Rubritalea tangerina]
MMVLSVIRGLEHHWCGTGSGVAADSRRLHGRDPIVSLERWNCGVY